LLTLLLGSGSASASAQSLARQMIERFSGLRRIGGASIAELQTISGLGAAKAAAVCAAFEVGRRVAGQELRPGTPVTDPEQVFRAFHARVRDARQESFWVLLLDGRHRFGREVAITQGTLTASLVHPREVFGPAVREAAAAVVLVHNHPSGDARPSREDFAVTRRLARAGRLLGIPVLDHVVVADGGWSSLRELGALGGHPPYENS
jgi:DNA repair protein RadC